MTSNGTNGTNSASSHTVPLYINGEEITTSTTFPVASPASGEILWHASSASKRDALSAIEAASQAFPAWSKTKPIYRRAILFKAAQLLEQREKECIEYMGQETGAVEGFSKFNVMTAAEMLKDIGGRIEEALHGEIPVCQDDSTQAMVLKEPFGVVLGLAPWNAPYILGLRCFIYAIAVGNTVVMKGSELSPRCFTILYECMREAGLPDGVLNLLYVRPSDAAEVTTALIEHPAIKKVNFTGSTAVGGIIAGAAGKNLKPVLMELGGKASAIVCEDADVERAALQCALGAFMHSGQICMSTERILVAESILDKFRPAFTEKVNQVFPSHTPAVLVQSQGVEKNKKLIADAVKKGAKVIHGDWEKEEISKTRMAPVVIEGTTKEMDLFDTESFGPSVSLIPFSTDEEAVSVANDTLYGLNGAVFTQDLARGLRIAKRMETGNVHVNGMTVHDEAALPHGGVKMSGWGRFNGKWGLDEFLRIKTITYQL